MLISSRSLGITCGLLLTFATSLGAQMTARTGVLEGEIEGKRSSYDRLVIEMINPGQPPERTYVRPDGSFEFRGIQEGQYEFRVLNLRGEVIQREFASVPTAGGRLEIRMREPKEDKPATGTVSVNQLLRPVPKQARKELTRSDKALQKGDIRESISHLEKAIQIHPEYMEAYNNLGVRYMRLNDAERAAAAFAKAAEIAPANPLAQSNLAVALVMLSRFQEAEAAARLALAQDREYAAARYALGLSYAAQQKCSAEAVEHLKAASDKFLKARLAAAKLMADCGAADQAVGQLEQYLDSPVAENRSQIETWMASLKRSAAGVSR